jgi:hypothetical protein
MDCGNGKLRTTKNGLWYHGAIHGDNGGRVHARSGMGKHGAPCFFKYNPGEKLHNPGKWDTHDPHRFCSNCIIDEEATKARKKKPLVVYRCLGHRFPVSDDTPTLNFSEECEKLIDSLEGMNGEFISIENHLSNITRNQ